MTVGFAFNFFCFLPCLLLFECSRFHLPVFFLPIPCSDLPSCASLHAAFLFSSPLSACFALASGLHCLPCGWFAWVEFFSLVFYPLPAFVFSSFTSESHYFSLAGLCNLLLVASPSLFFDQISLFFSFVFIGLASAVSSLALFVLAPCVDLLPASLSFSFFLGYAPYFLVLFLFFQSHCLSSFGGFLQRFPGFVCYFPFLFVLLVIVSSVIFGYVSLFCAFGSLPYEFPASSLLPLGLFQSSSSSAALLLTALGLPVLSLLLSSPGHLCSMFYFLCLVSLLVLIFF